MACLYKYELAVFLTPPPLQSVSLPSVSNASSLLRDCLGYSPFSLHNLSLQTTCSPRCLNLFIPQGPRVASSGRVCTNLSTASTSKQKRLSMESDLRRMQDFRVRTVGACREREKLEKLSVTESSALVQTKNHFLQVFSDKAPVLSQASVHTAPSSAFFPPYGMCKNILPMMHPKPLV